MAIFTKRKSRQSPKEKKGMYDLESMYRALEKCDQNIKVFEEAITQEKKSKLEYREIIKHLEAKRLMKEEIQPKVIPS